MDSQISFGGDGHSTELNNTQDLHETCIHLVKAQSYTDRVTEQATNHTSAQASPSTYQALCARALRLKRAVRAGREYTAHPAEAPIAVIILARPLGHGDRLTRIFVLIVLLVCHLPARLTAPALHALPFYVPLLRSRRRRILLMESAHVAAVAILACKGSLAVGTPETRRPQMDVPDMAIATLPRRHHGLCAPREVARMSMSRLSPTQEHFIEYPVHLRGEQECAGPEGVIVARAALGSWNELGIWDGYGRRRRAGRRVRRSGR
ncbi:hypothetical protein PENSPDRAFT_246455 [Peniophora sp. CONT]|nr:hypothetical protein PENSPDRAFT_246455 [Peniophora sp. CONT]